MEEVRRSRDGELCGFVAEREGRWSAYTVFGAELGRHDRRAAAVERVLEGGLASLSERWTLRNSSTGEEEIVCIREANPVEVSLTLGPYAMPGFPTMTLSRAQLDSGEWELRL
jgi:hypothetical protein